MKGSKRRPGKSSAYEDNFDKVFVKPRADPEGVKEAVEEIAALADEIVETLNEPSDLLDQQVEEALKRPVTELDKKRARFVEIHKR
jgi:hypothetical protein